MVGGLVLTSWGIWGPLFAEYCNRRGYKLTKWVLRLSIPVAMIFVLQSAIQRTGGALDGDESARQQLTERVRIAKAAEADAVAQLAIDNSLVVCDVIGPKCQRAKADRAATEAKLATARAKLKKRAVIPEDALTARLMGWFGWSKVQIQLYEPLLLPLCLALFGSLAISVSLRPHRKAASAPPGGSQGA